MNPFMPIIRLQLDLLYMYADMAQRMFHIYAAMPETVRATATSPEQAFTLKRRGCVGPADLRS